MGKIKKPFILLLYLIGVGLFVVMWQIFISALVAANTPAEVVVVLIRIAFFQYLWKTWVGVSIDIVLLNLKKHPKI